MYRAISISIIFHALLFAALIYSAKISLSILKAKTLKLENLGAVQVDLTYKPTDTPMKLGAKEKDLPPPKVEEEKKKEEEMVLKTKPQPKKEEGSKASKKPDLKSILDKIRQDSRLEDKPRPKPKEDNFPTHAQGEKGARGTGGRSLRAPTPAEQALQSAMRKHFELEEAATIRKNFPNAFGFFTIRLVGVGSQFELSALGLAQTTGIAILDRKCELAIREALGAEHFSSDVIQELNGKETAIICKP